VVDLLNDYQDEIDRLDKLIWRMRWWPLIPLILIEVVATSQWGLIGSLAALALVLLLSITLYFVRRPFVIRRIRLVSSSPDED
jgi:ABC-type transport system involved in cytochrome bd biosynthesis fused ATPase/permease subunit